ncbi:glycosyltransferase family 2 protein [Spirosoma sp. KUDC1026]|uniref:glycosyltransferase family 2 protein n=1 Tax=Spirosoma sp. KUDC1026 TaxID=2745947 RepID=UPI00159BCB6A|nr:glycosyltransferase family 2 protein [Spirosoma sp. KUDC1026]QKZ11934.1 glycosyltransferase [Spirosoma sp. KUDC1026]
MLPPLISIIITVLNGAKTMEDCLLSIAEQSFQDFELIVVDGGSSDNTVPILNRYSSVINQLKVIPGLGLYAGLNKGIELAQGKWLYFIGCDDQLYNSEVLRIAAISMKNTDAVILAGQVQHQDQYVTKPKFGLPQLLLHRIHHQGIFYNRTVFERYKYNEKLKLAADYELNLQLAVGKFKHQKLNLVIARYGGDGISNREINTYYKETQLVHKVIFTGLTRVWVVLIFWIKWKFWLFKYRTGLLGLSYRLKHRVIPLFLVVLK